LLPLERSTRSAKLGITSSVRRPRSRLGGEPKSCSAAAFHERIRSSASASATASDTARAPAPRSRRARRDARLLLRGVELTQTLGNPLREEGRDSSAKHADPNEQADGAPEGAALVGACLGLRNG